jgi:hypothetical protein
VFNPRRHGLPGRASLCGSYQVTSPQSMGLGLPTGDVARVVTWRSFWTVGMRPAASRHAPYDERSGFCKRA